MAMGFSGMDREDSKTYYSMLLEIFYLNTIEQLLLFVEQLDQLEVRQSELQRIVNMD